MLFPSSRIDFYSKGEHVGTIAEGRSHATGSYQQNGLGRERRAGGIRPFQEVKHLAIGELR
jgi:hypothetical protein